jgi:protein-S-isoprenylcysteine O-methyltransferase Ste14
VGEITPLNIIAWLWLFLFAFWLVAAKFVYPTKVRESFWQRQTHVLPLYFGFYLIFDHRWWGPMHHLLYDNDAIRYGGDVITFIGVFYAIWARVTLGRYWSGIITLKHGHRLIRTGPYRFTRHPLYTGFVIGVIGSAIASARIDAWIGAAIAVASLIFKLRREEKLLTGEFGEEYLQFRRDVPAALLPGLY